VIVCLSGVGNPLLQPALSGAKGQKALAPSVLPFLTHNSVFPILSHEPLLEPIACSNESEPGVRPVRSSQDGKGSETEGSRLPMPDPTQKKATYEDLYHLPDGVVGEILNGQLVATPRPSPRHARVSSALGITLGGPLETAPCRRISGSGAPGTRQRMTGKVARQDKGPFS